jgi:hypothetical protein
MSTKRTLMSSGCGDNYIRYHASGGGIERVFFSSGKQDDTLKKNTMDKTLEITFKSSINTMLPTCDDNGVFTMMMTHSGNGSSLQWQEVGRGRRRWLCDMDLLRSLVWFV